jgi:hypothetical protein
MPYSTITSLAFSTSSFAYFTFRITSYIEKSRIPSRAFLARYLLYKLNKLGEKQHTYLTPFPIVTLVKSSKILKTKEDICACYKYFIGRFCNLCMRFNQTCFSRYVAENKSKFVVP